MSQKLDELMAAMQKQHGKGSFVTGRQVAEREIQRIPTGIFALDYATGGGIPVGRFSAIYGKRSAGKSSLIAKVTASAQRFCRKCYRPMRFKLVPVTRVVKVTVEHGQIEDREIEMPMPKPIGCESGCKCKKGMGFDGSTIPGPLKVVWIDAEGTYDPEFYDDFGVVSDWVYVVSPDYGEAACDIADAAIRTGECDLLIVDTIAHMVPMVEREKSAEDANMAPQARMMNRACRTWAASQLQQKNLTGMQCTVILVNQIRVKIGLFPADTKPGGIGQDFVTSLEIKLRQAHKGFDFDKVTGKPKSMESEFTIEKNKVGPAKMEGKYKMVVHPHEGRFCGDTFDDQVVFEWAKTHSMIEGRKNIEIHGVPEEILSQFSFKSLDEVQAELSKYGPLYHVLRERLVRLATVRTTRKLVEAARFQEGQEPVAAEDEGDEVAVEDEEDPAEIEAE